MENVRKRDSLRGEYVYDYGLTDKTSISVETLAGIKYLDLTVEDGKLSLSS